MKELKYSKYPAQCPPKDAKEITGYYFRFCSPTGMCSIDFKTHVDRKLSFPPYKRCEAMALSFFTTQEEIERMKSKYPRFKKDKIYKIHINKNWGLAQLKGTHLNLWQFKGINFLKEAQKDCQEVD